MPLDFKVKSIVKCCLRELVISIKFFILLAKIISQKNLDGFQIVLSDLFGSQLNLEFYKMDLRFGCF